MNKIITMEGVKKTVFGSGSLSELGNECKKLGASKALLVMDRSLAKTEMYLKAASYLKKSGVKAFLFSDVAPEPDPKIADQGTEMAVKEKIRCVIGIGSRGTPNGWGLSPKSTINSSGVPVTRQKLA